MKVLVTGASGFLGGRLAELLAGRGLETAVIARPSARLGHLERCPVQVLRAAPADLDALTAALHGVTHVFHCAGRSTDWATWADYYEGNVTFTQTLLAAARTAGTVERILHVSTTDVYGYPRVPGDESQPLRDVGLPYNRTKILGERAVWQSAQDWGLAVTVVRPSSIYGPRGTAFGSDIAALLRDGWMAVVDGGRVPGGFVYVDNVAEAMITAAFSDETAGQAYNLADGSGVSWRAYVDALADGLGYRRPWINLPFPAAMAAAGAMELPYRPFGRWRGVKGRPLLTRHAVYILGRSQEVSIEKARREFGYRALVSFDEGIAHTVEWLKGLGFFGPRSRAGLR
jgi:nucleoside-diphosphate-sugar epimerase